MTIQYTPKLALPYPQGGDPADGPAGFQALAQAVENASAACVLRLQGNTGNITNAGGSVLIGGGGVTSSWVELHDPLNMHTTGNAIRLTSPGVWLVSFAPIIAATAAPTTGWLILDIGCILGTTTTYARARYSPWIGPGAGDYGLLPAPLSVVIYVSQTDWTAGGNAFHLAAGVWNTTNQPVTLTTSTDLPTMFSATRLAV